MCERRAASRRRLDAVTPSSCLLPLRLPRTPTYGLRRATVQSKAVHGTANNGRARVIREHGLPEMRIRKGGSVNTKLLRSPRRYAATYLSRPPAHTLDVPSLLGGLDKEVHVLGREVRSVMGKEDEDAGRRGR